MGRSSDKRKIIINNVFQRRRKESIKKKQDSNQKIDKKLRNAMQCNEKLFQNSTSLKKTKK